MEILIGNGCKRRIVHLPDSHLSIILGTGYYARSLCTKGLDPQFLFIRTLQNTHQPRTVKAPSRTGQSDNTASADEKLSGVCTVTPFKHARGRLVDLRFDKDMKFIAAYTTLVAAKDAEHALEHTRFETVTDGDPAEWWLMVRVGSNDRRERKTANHQLRQARQIRWVLPARIASEILGELVIED